MIAHQRDSAISTGTGPGAGTHPPSRARIPSLSEFAFSVDDSLDLDAAHLALACPDERLCDWLAGAQRTTRHLGVRGRIAYRRLLSELREACLPVVDAIERVQQIGE